MSAKHLVIEIAENETAAGLQSRLDSASAEGFFLVNSYGKLLLLRTSIAKAIQSGVSVGGFKSNKDGNDEAARNLIRQFPNKSVRVLVSMLGEVDIKRGRTWVCDARIAIRAEKPESK